jgi:hypothetical protein
MVAASDVEQINEADPENRQVSVAGRLAVFVRHLQRYARNARTLSVGSAQK